MIDSWGVLPPSRDALQSKCGAERVKKGELEGGKKKIKEIGLHDIVQSSKLTRKGERLI